MEPLPTSASIGGRGAGPGTRMRGVVPAWARIRGSGMVIDLIQCRADDGPAECGDLASGGTENRTSPGGCPPSAGSGSEPLSAEERENRQDAPVVLRLGRQPQLQE